MRVVGSPSEIVQKLLLDRYALRVEPMMGDYAARQLATPSRAKFAVLGGDARTGVPMRVVIDPAALTAPTPSITSRPATTSAPSAAPPSLFS